jgi:hypothetical protein
MTMPKRGRKADDKDFGYKAGGGIPLFKDSGKIAYLQVGDCSHL